MALGLNPQPAGAEVAAAMAVLARRQFEASIGIGCDGFTEPAGDAVPYTVFIAIDSEQIKQHTVQSYSGRLYQMKKRAAYYALFDLMKLLRST